MLWFMVMSVFMMFLFLTILGFIIGIVTGWWKLFIMSACGLVFMWVMLSMEDR